MCCSSPAGRLRRWLIGSLMKWRLWARGAYLSASRGGRVNRTSGSSASRLSKLAPREAAVGCVDTECRRIGCRHNVDMAWAQGPWLGLELLSGQQIRRLGDAPSACPVSADHTRRPTHQLGRWRPSLGIWQILIKSPVCKYLA